MIEQEENFEFYIRSARTWQSGEPTPIWAIPGGSLDGYVIHIYTQVLANEQFFFPGRCEIVIPSGRELTLRKHGLGIKPEIMQVDQRELSTNLIWSFYRHGPVGLIELDSLLPFSESFFLRIRSAARCFEQTFSYGKEVAPGHWLTSVDPCCIELKLAAEYFAGQAFHPEEIQEKIKALSLNSC